MDQRCHPLPAQNVKLGAISAALIALTLHRFDPLQFKWKGFSFEVVLSSKIHPNQASSFNIHVPRTLQICNSNSHFIINAKYNIYLGIAIYVL